MRPKRRRVPKPHPEISTLKAKLILRRLEREAREGNKETKK